MKKHRTQKLDAYQTITNSIISQLEKGYIPWRNPINQNSALIKPSNYFTKQPYKGINNILVNPFAFDHPYYLTLKQANQLGGTVLKGSKGMPIMYWNLCYYDSEGNKCEQKDAVKKSAFLNYYTVFNISQVEGIKFNIPEGHIKKDFQQIEICENIIANMENPPKIKISLGVDAYYKPVFDEITVPVISNFDNPECYYSVLFHELIHATGHKSRLNRKGIEQFDEFGSKQYSFEELIAELGSYFLSFETQISNPDLFKNTAAYIQNWIRVLKNDNKMIVLASSQAQRAVNYIQFGNQNSNPDELSIAS